MFSPSTPLLFLLTSPVDTLLLLLSQARQHTGQIFQILTVKAKKAKHNFHFRRVREFIHIKVSVGVGMGLSDVIQWYSSFSGWQKPVVR